MIDWGVTLIDQAARRKDRDKGFEGKLILSLGGEGSPTGEIKAKPFTCSGYLITYLADKYPPIEWPARVKSFIPWKTRNSSTYLNLN